MSPYYQASHINQSLSERPLFSFLNVSSRGFLEKIRHNFIIEQKSESEFIYTNPFLAMVYF